jgi:Lysozyme like domain
MGDIWPYGPPQYATWDSVYNLMFNFTRRDDVSRIMAAIGVAESSLDWTVINDTPSTGDYSVGIWQINYYNGLYQSRAAQFGTPQQLVAGGPGLQARAALAIAYGPGGYTNWSTYNSGAYQRYLRGFVPTPGPPGPGTVSQLEPPPPPPAPAADWSGYVRLAGDSHIQVARWIRGYRYAIQRL